MTQPAITPDTPATTEAVTPPATPPANPLLRQRQYAFPANETDKIVNAALLQRGKSANLKGFRPGKAPVSVLQRMFGKEILQQVITEQAQRKFETDMQEAKEPLASRPHFVPEVLIADNAYQITCHYEIMPNISPPDFTGATLKTPTLSVGEAEIDEMTETLREQHGTFVPHVGKAINGCRLLVDIVTDIDTSEDRLIQLGSPTLLPEINEALAGAVEGDVCVAKPTMPDSHPDEAMRGKQVDITITVKKVEILQKAELNEEFFTSLGTESGGNLAGFRAMVAKHLQREVSVRLRNIRQQRALDKLIEQTPPFDLPQTLLYEENVNLLRGAQAHWEKRGGAEVAASLTLEAFFPEAQKRVRLGLILSDWQVKNTPEITDEMLDTRIEEITESYETPAQKKTEIRANPQQMEAVRLSVLEDLVVNWVYSQTTNEDETLALSQLLKDPAANGAPEA